MIEKIKIRGYRIFREFEMSAQAGSNLIVGGNEVGKSTLLEAITLALTGRINGRPAAEELNPYWFNVGLVEETLVKIKNGEPVQMPEILIELFFKNTPELQLYLGANNSDSPPPVCPGISFRIMPNPEYSAELEAWKASGSRLIPVDYYTVEGRYFSGEWLLPRQKLLATAVIDSRTIRSPSGIDYHMRQILNSNMTPAERADVSISYRKVKEDISVGALKKVNDRLATEESAIQNQHVSLAMDQSSRTGWDNVVTPHVQNIPMAMAGQGAQAAIKIGLALSKTADRARYVTIEEPESHQSHTSLTQLLSRIEGGAGKEQQLFITTHSAYVLNRLGIDKLTLLSAGNSATMKDLDPETVAYFQKLPGYDTLRLVLAAKLVLVEGPSDEIYFERVFLDLYGKRPMELGIDVLSMRGLSFKRCLALCKALDKQVVALRDNDGKGATMLRANLNDFLLDGRRSLYVSDTANGRTLEPQLRAINEEEALRAVLDIQAKADLATWMEDNKTEGALRIASSPTRLQAPQYMIDAAREING